MLEYNDVKEKVFYQGRIRNGYFGDTILAQFALVPCGSCFKIVTITDDGYHTLALPPVLDEAEAVWIMEHRPYYSDGKPYVIREGEYVHGTE
jgi:hypothetical protein